MEDDFDMAGAVDSIGADLGFGDGDGSDGGVLDAGAGDDNGNNSNLGDAGAGALDDAGAAPAGTGTGDPAAPAAAAATPAPRTWRPEAAAEWDKLPETVRSEILKREEDIFKGIEGYKADAAQGRAFGQAIAPFRQLLQQYNIDPVQQVNSLMQAHYTLALGTPEQKSAFLQQLMQDYDIQLPGQAQGDPYVNPEVAALQQQLRAVQSETRAMQQERLEQQRQSIEAEIAKFASDPANLYFKEVVNDMATLIQANKATSVKEAYDMAVWQNPAIRQREIDRQQTEKAAKAARDAEEKAEAARKASSANVRSTAKQRGAAAPKGSMDDTLNETLASIMSRS